MIVPLEKNKSKSSRKRLQWNLRSQLNRNLDHLTERTGKGSIAIPSNKKLSSTQDLRKSRSTKCGFTSSGMSSLRRELNKESMR